MTSESEVEIYRLRLSRGTGSGNGHSPDWRLYESRERWEDDLLEAMIEAHGRTSPNYGMGRDSQERYDRAKRVWRACRYWVTHVFKRDPSGHGIQQVIGAEKLVDGEWMDVKPRLLPPRLEFGA